MWPYIHLIFNWFLLRCFFTTANILSKMKIKGARLGKIYLLWKILPFLTSVPNCLPSTIIWLEEFNNGCGVGRGFSLKIGLYLKIFEKFKLSQLFLLMIVVYRHLKPTVTSNLCNSKNLYNSNNLNTFLGSMGSGESKEAGALFFCGTWDPPD